VIYPVRRIALMFESLQLIRGLMEADNIEGGTILPGFRLPLKSLFE
jgi:hypothetical protein